MEKRLKKYEPEAIVKSFMFYPGGEIDLFMLLNGQVHNYEIKRSDHQKSRAKTNCQLLRAQDYWLSQGLKDITSYYVHGNKGEGLWHYDVERVTSFNPLNFRHLAHYKIGRGF